MPVPQQKGRSQQGNQQTSEPTTEGPHTCGTRPEARDAETAISAGSRSFVRTGREGGHGPGDCDMTDTQGARSTVVTEGFRSHDSGSASCGDCGGDFGVSHSSQQRHERRSESALPECIVCQNQPLNCVLLPCRHTCVCHVCFEKLDRCPMCRSHIESFFILTDEGVIAANSAPDEPAVPMDLYSRFERFNRRLNEFLGFD